MPKCQYPNVYGIKNIKCTIAEVSCKSQGHTNKQQCIDYHYNFRKHMQILEFIENDLNYIQKDTQLNSQNFAFPATIYAAIFVTLIFGDLRTNLQCTREIMKTQYFLGAPNPLETSRKQLECKTSALSKNVPAKKIKTHQFNSCGLGLKMNYSINLYKQILFRNSGRMLSSILLLSQVKQQLQQLCANNLVQNGKQFTFCQKAVQINQQKVDSAAHVSEKSGNIFLYTELAKDSNMSFYVSHVNSFAVFGFNLVDQTIINCTVNISIDYQVVQAALICLQCDLITEESVFVFIASGQYISGVMLMSQNYIKLNSTQIQARLNSSSASGIVNKVPTAMTNFTVQDCMLTAYFWLTSSTSGYISSDVLVETQINIANFTVCVNSQDFGAGSKPVSRSWSEIQKCESICSSGLYYTYGLCLSSLDLGAEVDFKLECSNDFQFDGTKCSCKDGFLLDGTACMNVVLQITQLGQKMLNASEELEQQINQNISAPNQKVDSFVDQIEPHIIGNASFVDLQIAGNASALDSDLARNSSFITNEIELNATQFKEELLREVDKLKRDLKASILVLQRHIKGYHFGFDADLNSQTNTTEQEIIKNTTELLSKQQVNFSYLDQQNHNNSTAAVNNIVQNSIYLNTSIDANYTDLLARIYANNISDQILIAAIQQSIKDNITQTMNTIDGIYLKIADYKAKQKSICDGKLTQQCGQKMEYHFQKRTPSCTDKVFTNGCPTSAGCTNCQACSMAPACSITFKDCTCTMGPWSTVSNCSVPSNITYGGSDYTSGSCRLDGIRGNCSSIQTLATCKQEKISVAAYYKYNIVTGECYCDNI
ncbi:Conserved_hypothetical protein [Hexamita inflata]|uniref:Uncharacterized protein n=1 Tax=Hexamita inflata TaxID=28002 RepID=A0AA86R9L8_9EUKA|nr:Conserved hypothetical protein [Hexamita inflata]